MTGSRHTPDVTEVAGLPEWKASRRRAIVQAALEALREQDYEHIQIRQVAESAGVALGTLYRYFNSKDHLYAEVIAEWGAPVIGGVLVDSRPTEVRVRSKVRGIISAFERRPQFFKAAAVLQNTTDPIAKELISNFAQACVKSMIDDFEPLGEQAAVDAAMILWSVVNTVVGQAIFHGHPMGDAYRLADTFIDLISPQLPAHERH